MMTFLVTTLIVTLTINWWIHFNLAQKYDREIEELIRKTFKKL